MKILLFLLIVVVAIGVYFSVNENKKSAVVFSEEATELLLVQDNAKILATAQLEEGTSSNPNNKLLIDENESGQIARSRNEQVIQSELTSSAELRLTKDIEGFFDPNAIAPEDESVQIVYDDAMQVSVSDALAPEAGTEMMPAGDGMPMYSESTEGANAPESMDDNN
ncbi:MAG: hypothetical protein ACI936_001159 [Paraglaciecola sp.]